MKRIAIVRFIIIPILAGTGLYLMCTSGDEAIGRGQENTVLKVVTRVKSGRTESIKIGSTELDVDGKKTRIDFPDTDRKEVNVRLAPSVRFKDGQPDGTFWVTIKAEQPPIFTKGTYEKIQIGMTYPQVGEALGGVMTKGRMSDGFSSKLELIQGTRRIYVTFADGMVTEKSARDLE
jgi:hypothetical protein